MSFLGNSNAGIFATCQHFLSLGWSLIPLWGDRQPDRAKSPALPSWAAYQHRQPTLSELATWLETPTDVSAVGIVLGSVSSLVAIDIDDPAVAEAFAQALPDLTNTLTVKSGNRGLPHYYFQVPDDLHISGRTIKGLELRSNGQYVVAPGSKINGHVWQITQDRPPRMLSERDLRRLLAFIRSMGQSESKNPSTGISERENIHSQHPLTQHQAIRNYQKLARLRGRNNALFQVGCDVRDCGWTLQQAETVFIPLHVRQAPMQPHQRETPSQRYREAQATLRSVYSQAPRKPKTTAHKESKQLPNTIREKFLSLGLVNLARLLDALILAGITANQYLTPGEIYKRVSGFGIGRNMIYTMLKTLTPNGESVFKAPSPRTPQPHHANAAKRCAEQTKQCLFGRDSKPGKNKLGRPKQVVVMPNVDDLCVLFGVKNLGGDTLEANALKSPKAYRAALHAALFQRAPGKYPRRWQATRLGVSRATCRRYDRVAGVVVRPSYRAFSVGWHNLESVLSDEPIMGCFLVDGRGKRYPAKRLIARMLLSKNQSVTYMIQDANSYSMTPIAADDMTRFAADFADIHAQVSAATQGKVTHKIASPDYQSTSVLDVQLVASQQVKLSSATTLKTPPKEQSTMHQAAEQSTLKNAIGKNDLAAQMLSAEQKEAVAESIYQALRAVDPAHGLTRKRARTLVDTYNITLIMRGLRTLKSRASIRNPSGFLLSWLHSECLGECLNEGRKSDALSVV